jgi:hypothetical protein
MNRTEIKLLIIGTIMLGCGMLWLGGALARTGVCV